MKNEELNPCFQCLCISMCRNKPWSTAMIKCQELLHTIEDHMESNITRGLTEYYETYKILRAGKMIL